MGYIDYILKYPVPSIGVFITILPITLLLTRKELNTPLRVLLFYLISKLSLDLMAFHLAANKINNLLIGNISILSSLIIISVFFYHVFINDRVRFGIIIMSILYSFIFLIDFFYSNPILNDWHNHHYVSISTSLRSGCILILCMIFYYELMKELYIEDLSRSTIFWSVSGILIYHSVCLFSSAIFNFCYRWGFDHKMNSILHMQYYVEVVMCIMISIGVIRYRKYSY